MVASAAPGATGAAPAAAASAVAVTVGVTSIKIHWEEVQPPGGVLVWPMIKRPSFHKSNCPKCCCGKRELIERFLALNCTPSNQVCGKDEVERVHEQLKLFLDKVMGGNIVIDVGLSQHLKQCLEARLKTARLELRSDREVPLEGYAKLGKEISEANHALRCCSLLGHDCTLSPDDGVVTCLRAHRNNAYRMSIVLDPSFIGQLRGKSGGTRIQCIMSISDYELCVVCVAQCEGGSGGGKSNGKTKIIGVLCCHYSTKEETDYLPSALHSFCAHFVEKDRMSELPFYATKSVLVGKEMIILPDQQALVIQKKLTVNPSTDTAIELKFLEDESPFARKKLTRYDHRNCAAPPTRCSLHPAEQFTGCPVQIAIKMAHLVVRLNRNKPVAAAGGRRKTRK